MSGYEKKETINLNVLFQKPHLRVFYSINNLFCTIGNYRQTINYYASKTEKPLKKDKKLFITKACRLFLQNISKKQDIGE